MREHYDALGDIAGMLHAAELDFESHRERTETGVETGYKVWMGDSMAVVAGDRSADFLSIVCHHRFSRIDGFDHERAPAPLHDEGSDYVGTLVRERNITATHIDTESVEANDTEYFDGVAGVRRIHPFDENLDARKLTERIRGVVHTSKQLWLDVIEEFEVSVRNDDVDEKVRTDAEPKGFR